MKKVARERWGLDWRVRLGVGAPEERGLGCIEGNQAHLLAVRMKGKGRSWSPAGAHHMAKVRELLANQEMDGWCYRSTHTKKPPRRPTRKPPPRRTDPGQWLQASLPALHGLAHNAPWVHRLRKKIHPPYLPN